MRIDNNMPLSLSQLEDVVEEAFEYWQYQFWDLNKNALKDLSKPMKRFQSIATATQLFVETACLSNTDIEFVFAYEALTPNQKQIVDANVGEVLARTYRSFYDRKNLKGKGFTW